MELSSNLLKEFAAITKDNNLSNDGLTAYGTIYISDGETYVKLDGSNMLMPVESLVQVHSGDRVSVKIKNHTASVQTWEWQREGSFSLINLRNPASQEINATYNISNVNNSGATTVFRIPGQDQPFYDLDQIIFANVRVYFTEVEYDSEKDSIEPVGEMLNAKIASYIYDDSGEYDYYDITLDSKLDDLTDSYKICFTVWNVDVFTDIRNGLITVDGEHEDTWVGDGSGRKNTRYLSIGVDSLNYLDPVHCSDEYFDEETEMFPQTIKAYDPSIEPYGYADLELTGDTFRTYGVGSIVEWDDEREDYVETLSDETGAYVTPYARVYPGGAQFGMKGVTPMDPSELPEDVESISHPAYNELEIKSGYVEPEDAIIFTRHVKQTEIWADVESDPEYKREYFTNPNVLISEQKYSPVWPYKPGDETTISYGQYLVYVQGRTGSTTTARQNIMVVVELGRPISEYVTGISVSGRIAALIHSKDGVIYNTSDTETSRTFPASGNERINVTNVAFTSLTGQVRMILEIARGKTYKNSSYLMDNYSTGTVSINELKLTFS